MTLKYRSEPIPFAVIPLGITPIKSNKILVKTGAKVYIHAFDQSVDSLADCMIGYRFTKTRIKNPNEANAREVLVENVEQIPYTDDNGVTTNYILVDGYTTTIDLTTVKLDDKATINYQMILTRINYSLKVFTDKYVGVLAVYYKNVDYTNNFEFNFNSINVDDSMGATFYPNIGYELVSWRLNDNNNFETLYAIYLFCQLLNSSIFTDNIKLLAKSVELNLLINFL